MSHSRLYIVYTVLYILYIYKIQDLEVPNAFRLRIRIRIVKETKFTVYCCYCCNLPLLMLNTIYNIIKPNFNYLKYNHKHFYSIIQSIQTTSGIRAQLYDYKLILYI